MFLHQGNFFLPFRFVYIAVFGMPSLKAGISWYLLIVESSLCGWGFTSVLSRFLGWGNLYLCFGGWSLISFLWSAIKCPVVSFVVYGFGMALGSLSFKVKDCVPVLLENYHDVFFNGSGWLLCGPSFQCRYGDFWVGPCLLMSTGVRSSLML